MLPPVFYVQQLEQILLRKLLSPPTPAARPLRFLPAPRRRCRTYVRIQFFRSLFSCRATSIDLARLRCAPLPFPAPRARPSRRICAYIHIQFFVRFFRVEPRPFGSALVIFRFLVFPFFFDPYFRRFYDFFLRRKHLESLVRVIRPFGVRPRATRAKKFSGLTFSPAGL